MQQAITEAKNQQSSNILMPSRTHRFLICNSSKRCSSHRRPQRLYQQPAPPQPVYQQPPPPAAPTGVTNDQIAQLKQLGALHESGVLTDAEFGAAKQKILGI